ncbi:hypothetical protein [Pseudomonas sp. NFXW11]|uniref:hypothetical protein n=1 Tax=Pseudomonas sp. NFXW11 TaxID=2819531 RepID=UPI003CF0D06F
MNSVCVDGVCIGKAKNPGQGLVSDTDQDPVANRFWLWIQGLGSGEQADPRFHTGVEYSAEYARLQGVSLEEIRA